MPDLNLRTLSREARERIEHALRPLLSREDELSLRALRRERVHRLAGGREAVERNARVDDTGLEDVGVRTGEHVGHHRARGRADCEDAVGVDAPISDGEAHGGDDAKGVAASVVLERRVGGDVPAGAGVRLRATGESGRPQAESGLTEDGKSRR